MPHPLLIFLGGNAVADEELEGIEPPAIDELLALSAKDLHRIGGIVHQKGEKSQQYPHTPSIAPTRR
jgi:hypothetical protein